MCVTGEPYQPRGQYRISGRGEKEFGHFSVLTLRPLEHTSDLQLSEVGPTFSQHGRFESIQDGTGGAELAFVGDGGEGFIVVNPPADPRLGLDLDLWAYFVKPSTTTHHASLWHLWIDRALSATDPVLCREIEPFGIRSQGPL